MYVRFTTVTQTGNQKDLSYSFLADNIQIQGV